ERTVVVLVQVAAADAVVENAEFDLAGFGRRFGDVFDPDVFASVVHDCAHRIAFLLDQAAEARRGVNLTGIRLMPPIRLDATRSTGPVSSISGIRSRMSVSIRRIC